MRPRAGEMRCGELVAECGDAAVLFDQLQLPLGIQIQAVKERHLIERTGVGALHAGAIVAPDVEHQRVVGLAEILDRVQQPANIPVRIFREPGEHLHLAGKEPFLRLRHTVPRGE